MSERPKLLDLFCGAGGASMGYHRAGFDVVGVDINPQPHYPFRFIQADWAEPLAFLPGLWERHGEPFAIHASPPCQRYSSMTKKWAREGEHPDLVGPVREALELLAEDGVPYVIENVQGAPLRDPITLCGTMFGLRATVCGCGSCFDADSLGKYGCPNCWGEGSNGLRRYELQRHRLFESNVTLWPPATCCHQAQPLPVYGHAGGRSKRDGLKFPGTDAWREGMGIDWMTGKELAEAIPPAYTEHVGKQLLAALEHVR